jgi:hypothetical protein
MRMLYLRLTLILMVIVVCYGSKVSVGFAQTPATTTDLPRSQTKAVSVPQPKPTRQSLLQGFQTLYITSETRFFEAEVLQKELYQNKLWNQWSLTVVDDVLSADMVITIDRPALTFDYVFKLVDQKNQIVVCAGKKIAFDGVRAARGIADQVVKCIKESNRLIPQENQRDKNNK